MSTDPLADLTAAGVSVWLDDLDRGRLDSGGLARLIDDRHVVGVTTNPTIFDKAISSGAAAYAPSMAELADAGATAEDAVRILTSDDVRRACDLMHDAWVGSEGVDGRVSIEVDPRLAFDTAATIVQARDLWNLVDRPNALIKIPATLPGLPAITDVLGSGISVNVTLIFSVDRYEAVIDAWLSGLELARANGHDLSTIESVASFFVSRVDTLVDARLEGIGTDEALALRGRAALANARLAWAAYERALASARWASLDADGARPQRPLWASTGVKNPAYDDTMYVVGLVGPGCVNTMPEATLDAVADHGIVTADTVTGTAVESQRVWDDLAALGIDHAQVFSELESEGVTKFIDSWNALLATVTSALASPRH